MKEVRKITDKREAKNALAEITFSTEIKERQAELKKQFGNPNWTETDIEKYLVRQMQTQIVNNYFRMDANKNPAKQKNPKQLAIDFSKMFLISPLAAQYLYECLDKELKLSSDSSEAALQTIKIEIENSLQDINDILDSGIIGDATELATLHDAKRKYLDQMAKLHNLYPEKKGIQINTAPQTSQTLVLNSGESGENPLISLFNSIRQTQAPRISTGEYIDGELA